jgi:hypothetical protein
VARRVRGWVRLGVGLLLAWGGLVGVVGPGGAPGWVLAGLATAWWPLGRAWRGSEGTALRLAVVWGGLALALGMVAQGVGCREALATGRPGAGHWCYLAMLSGLAALISVLNARRPGSGAWALLMGLLVLVFLIPWLEGSGPLAAGGGRARLRLETPWTVFFLVLVVAGVTNYVPTRYGLAAVWLALGFAAEYAALTRRSWPLSWRGAVWSLAPWTLAVALWSAEAAWSWTPAAPPGLERLWLWFRDHWGVVWALRVRERFNRAAEAAGWPMRLGWEGLELAEPGAGARDAPAEALALLKSLLRRFADPERLDRAAGVADASRTPSRGATRA